MTHLCSEKPNIFDRGAHLNVYEIQIEDEASSQKAMCKVIASELVSTYMFICDVAQQFLRRPVAVVSAGLSLSNTGCCIDAMVEIKALYGILFGLPRSFCRVRFHCMCNVAQSSGNISLPRVDSSLTLEDQWVTIASSWFEKRKGPLLVKPILFAHKSHRFHGGSCCCVAQYIRL